MLDVAMHLYVEEANYFCTIHLAGAAWELFDGHLRKEERIHALARRAQEDLYQRETGNEPNSKMINDLFYGAKNAIKHMNDGEPIVTCNSELEARWYIDHAMLSAEKTIWTKTPSYWRYVDYTNAKMSR